MRDWLIGHLEQCGGDVETATAACLDDFAQLEPPEQRSIIRAGLRAYLATAVKRTKLIVKNGENDDQLAVWASVLTNGRWTRMNHLRLTFPQLLQRRRNLAEQHKISSDQLTRLDIDIDLYARHTELPDVEAVYQAEGVEYRVEALA